MKWHRLWFVVYWLSVALLIIVVAGLMMVGLAVLLFALASAHVL